MTLTFASLLLLISVVSCGKFEINLPPSKIIPETVPTPQPAIIKGSWVRQFGLISSPKDNKNIAVVNRNDDCFDTAVDAGGNVYCAGSSNGSIGEPNGFVDPVIIKMSPQGVILWATQLGKYTKIIGGNNNGHDHCQSIALDATGNIFCGGSTGTSLGEAYGGGSSDAFVMKLDPTGKLLWLKQLGAITGSIFGSSSGNETCNGVDVDALGNVYCGGKTTGSLGEANGGSEDAFIMKLNPDGILQWITQLGATTKHPSGSNNSFDVCEDLKVSTDGYSHCAGWTLSSMGEASSNRDAFLFQLNPQGGLVWLTHLGQTTKSPSGNNSGSDMCSTIALDGLNNVYCGGNTNGSMDESGVGQDSMVLKLNGAGILQWVTQLGAVTRPSVKSTDGSESCDDIDIDASGNLYCALTTSSSFGEAAAGGTDIAVFKLTNAGALVWASQLGVTSKDPVGNNVGTDRCNGISVDANGSVYCGGNTSGSMADTQGGIFDIVMSKFDVAGTFLWIKQLGTSYTNVQPTPVASEYEECIDFVVDSQGSSICLTHASNTNFAEAKGGNGDLVIVKYSANGDLKWKKQLGALTKSPTGNNIGSEYFTTITVDESDNIIAAGSSSGDMDEANGGSDDAVVVKFDPEGSLLWVTQLGQATKAPLGSNSGNDQCNSVSVDRLSNIYCVGTTTGNMGELSGGGRDVFVLKLSPTGSLQWVTQLGATTKPAGADTTGADQCWSLTVDPDGNVYAGGGTLLRFAEAQGAGNDIYYFKLSPSGQFLWGKQLGAITVPVNGSTAGNDRITGFSVDSQKNVYFVANSTGSLAETNAGGDDVIIGKFDPNGNLFWVKQFGTVTKVPGGNNLGSDWAADIIVGPDDNFYITGYTLGSFAEPKALSYDSFVLKFTPTGDLIWATQMGSVTKVPGYNNDGDNFCYALGLDKTGAVYCGGAFSGDAAEPSAGDYDLGIVKLTPLGKLQF